MVSSNGDGVGVDIILDASVLEPGRERVGTVGV